jgi:hypothetical protein
VDITLAEMADVLQRNPPLHTPEGFWAFWRRWPTLTEIRLELTRWPVQRWGAAQRRPELYPLAVKRMGAEQMENRLYL